METTKLPGEKLGEFLRERGLHSEHLTLWDQELTEMVENKQNKRDRENRALKKKVKELERELNRKEKALAETAALLVLKKSSMLLWGTARATNS